MENGLLCLFFFLLLILSVYKIERLKVSNFVFIYSLLWLTAALFSSVLFNYYISIYAYFSILLLVVSFTLPCFIFDLYENDFENNTIFLKFDLRNMYLIFYMFICIAIFGLYMHVKSTGSDSIINVAENASIMRYSDNSFGSKWQVLGSALLFVILYFYGLSDELFINNKSILFITVFLVLLTAILTSSKASFLFSLAFYLTGFISKIILNKQLISLRYKKSIFYKVIILFSIVIGFSVVVQLFRYGFKLDQIYSVIDKVSIYIFGQYAAYSVWFDTMRDVDHSLSIPGYGIFTGLYSFLLDIKRESGFYDEMIYVTETQWTNVFTLTRFIIHEFGIVGGATMMVVLGTTYSIFNRLFKKHPLVQVFILLPIILECFFSFSTSILSYNSVVFSIIIIYMIAFFCNAKGLKVN